MHIPSFGLLVNICTDPHGGFQSYGRIRVQEINAPGEIGDNLRGEQNVDVFGYSTWFRKKLRSVTRKACETTPC